MALPFLPGPNPPDKNDEYETARVRQFLALLAVLPPPVFPGHFLAAGAQRRSGAARARAAFPGEEGVGGR